MMGEKLVEIVTSKGTVYAIFQCGLEQGNPDSPTIANLVIKMKHDIWRTVSNQAKKIFEKNDGGQCDRYEFNTIDPDDFKIILYMIGYCDDNSKFISASNEDDLIFLVKYYIQLAGNLSMVTKIGRKSSKCDVHFFNISAQFAVNLQKYWSTAWSFIHDAPIQEQVPYKIFLQQEEMAKFYDLVKYNELSLDERERWDNIVKPKAHKHLGLQATLQGDTSMSSVKTIEKMHNRFSQLKLHRMDPPAQRKCANMLVSSMHSFVPLQSNHDQAELIRLDESLFHHIRNKNGISLTDCKHRIFIPEAKGGLGFFSNLEIDIISVARELEIILNGEGLDSTTLRGRTMAIMGYDDIMEDKIMNHIMQAIFKLSRYGIHLRDSRDDIINDILRALAINQNGFSVGDPQYKGGNGAHLGYGKEKLLKFSFGNTIHRLLRHMQKNKWEIDTYATELSKTCNIPITTILQTRDEVGKARYEQFDDTFSFREWTNFKNNTVEPNLSKNHNDWKDHRFISNTCTLSQPKWTRSHQQLLEFAENQHDIDWTRHIIRQKEEIGISYSFNTYTIYGKIMNFLHKRGSPIIISTDGSHDPYTDTSKYRNTSAALTICALDIRVTETIESQEWTNRPMIPLLCRSTLLPNKIGHSESDIAHGECFAIVMEELLLNPLIPRIVIMDSEAVRHQVINVRQTCNEDIDRTYVRTQAGGISKSFISIIRNKLSTAYSLCEKPPINPSMQWLIDTFSQRNKKFLEIAEQWTTTQTANEMEEAEEKAMAKWPKDYFDGDSKRAILQVNSHQLDGTGSKIKQSPRFAQPIPNLAIASANHHADIGADLAIQASRLEPNRSQTSGVLTIPPSNLNYFLTIGGNSLDRHVSDHIRKALDNERVKRIKLKPTQGLLWRILDHTTTTWNVIRLHPGLHRSLLGLSGTHTRYMYKSVPYRTGCLMDHLETIKDTEQREAIINSSIQNQLSILSQCPICNQPKMCLHKGNRRHAFLSCNHSKLAKFKEKMNNMLGNRMYLLIREFKEFMEWNEIEQLIKNINSAFLLLQKDQTGRLVRLPIECNNTYLPVMEILRKHAIGSIQEAINNLPGAFFTHLLGITPEASHRAINDEEIGVVDAPWLGLVPKNIDKVVKTTIAKETRKIIDKDTAQEWKVRIQQSWREIKAIIIGRAAGIHKVITSIFQDREDKLIEKHNLQHLVKEVFRRKQKRKLNVTQSTTCNQAPAKKLKIDAVHTKNCNGITCGQEAKMWCPNSNFQLNRIPINRKQCQRCSMFCTAMNAASDLFDDIARTDERTVSKFVNQTLKASKKARTPYTSLMDLLKNSAPDNKHFVKAKFISKNRPSEKWKRICRIISTSLQHPSSCNQKQSPVQLIQSATSTIKSTLRKKNSEIQSNKINLQNYIKELSRAKEAIQYTKQQENIPQSESSSAHIDVKATSPPAHTPQKQISHVIIDLCESTPITTMDTPESVRKKNNEDVILKGKLDTMDQASWMTGAQLTYIIDVLRADSIGQDIFIANTQASHIIHNWDSNHGWQRFARIFNNHRVTHRKPNGLYLIPIFAGDVSRGHWYLLVVDKSARRKDGFILDSLGVGDKNSSIVRKISDAFTPGRGHSINWSNPASIIQQGCECGPRTACAMETLSIGRRRSIGIQESIRNATLMTTTPTTAYDQMTYRRRAATLIGRHAHLRIIE